MNVVNDSTTVSIPLKTLKWWRELVDLNPADLAPRMDAYLTAEPVAFDPDPPTRAYVDILKQEITMLRAALADTESEVL